MLTGDKLVDPYMYPGLCVDYCNGKGASVRQESKYKTDCVSQVSAWPVWKLVSGPDTPNHIQPDHSLGNICYCANELTHGSMTDNLIQNKQCSTMCTGSRKLLHSPICTPPP